jgi:hypothetical protein
MYVSWRDNCGAGWRFSEFGGVIGSQGKQGNMNVSIRVGVVIMLKLCACLVSGL